MSVKQMKVLFLELLKFGSKE